ncbi:MAG: ABC transporter permease [Lachnospiraceae bacterium]|nr:ABC transporter permease [Lachnospiraceae bacterium]
MKKSTLRKEFFREIARNKGRFISIVFIVMLGTAFFAGLRSTCYDMKYSADKYYDDADLTDIRVIGTLGLTESDVSAVSDVSGVDTAVGLHTVDVMCDTKESQLVMKVIGLTEGINTPVLTEGRMPENENECLFDAGSMARDDLEIGDVIKLSSGNEDEDDISALVSGTTRLSETLSTTEFTIVGKTYLPNYMGITRGTTKIGDGSLDSFIVVFDSVFNTEVYNEVLVKVSGAKEENSFSDEYAEKINEVKKKIESLSAEMCGRRLSEVKIQGKAKIEEYRNRLSEAIDEYGEDFVKEFIDPEEASALLDEKEEELEKTEAPTLYVLDRNTIESYVTHEADAERMKSIGRVFPVMFFLVAALVSLTAMTRMVEEQRSQIGTLKALGYGNRAIAGRYFAYAMLATITGSVIGIALGEWLLPYIICKTYAILYRGLNVFLTPINWDQAALAIIAAALCTGLATLSACGMQLRSGSAELMRPEAPKNGRRVLLEKTGSFWKKMSFGRKATLRNLARYKKRFIMTVIGVGGCMGLILVGLGLIDSITVVAKNQFINIFTSSATVTIDAEADDDVRRNLVSLIDSYEGIDEYAEVITKRVSLGFEDKDIESVLYVPMESENIGDFLTLRNRKTGEVYDFPEEGAVISEKTADMLGLKVGDYVSISEDVTDGVKVKVTNIVENYIQHYLFISAGTYEKLYGKKPVPTSILLKYDGVSESEEKKMETDILKMPGCSGFSSVTDLEKNIDDMLGVLNDIMWILIVSAGLLAFVVIYNLNSINITERKRELATLKVLGYYDNEVSMYVFRENIILTFIGILLGFFAGTVLHRFTVTTVEVDLMMFGRRISNLSYLYAALITMGFSILVNLYMSKVIKKIDMIDSLKSVE